MARWDEKRNCWRIAVDDAPPGAPRHRVYRDVREPNNQAGRRAAELFEARLKLQAAETRELQWPGGTRGQSFAAEAAAWVERNRHRWSPKTVKETQYALAHYILPGIGPVPLDRLSPAKIEALYASWEGRGYAPPTRRRWHGIVNAVFADAERLGNLTVRNPMARVRAAGGPAPERVHIPSPQEVRAAIDAAATPAVATFFELAAATGARRGTLVALRWRDVDLPERTVSFSHAVTVGPEGPVVKGTKANRPYATKISGQALDALREHRARAAESALALGLGSLEELFVFSSDGGKAHWDVSYPSHAWLMACQKAGIAEPCRLHDLRHFAATRLLAASIPVRVVAERLGCTEANVIRTYSHRVPSLEDDRAADVLAQALGG